MDAITKLDTNITLVWVPAHVGLSGNEVADQLAKSALQHNNIDLNIKFEARELISIVDNFVLWQSEWASSQSTIAYRSCHKSVSKLIKHSENTRQHQVLITRLRLGACGLNHHLCRIGCHDNGCCTSCNVPETVEHFLLDCPHSAVAAALKLKCAELNAVCQLQNCLSVPALTKLTYLNRSKI